MLHLKLIDAHPRVSTRAVRVYWELYGIHKIPDLMWRPTDQSLVLPRGKRVYPLGKRNSVSRTAGKRTVHVPLNNLIKQIHVTLPCTCRI